MKIKKNLAIKLVKDLIQEDKFKKQIIDLISSNSDSSGIAKNEEKIFNLTGGLAEMKTQVELLESEYTWSDAPKKILQDLRQQQADNKSAIKITAAEIKFFS